MNISARFVLETWKLSTILLLNVHTHVLSGQKWQHGLLAEVYILQVESMMTSSHGSMDYLKLHRQAPSAYTH